MAQPLRSENQVMNRLSVTIIAVMVALGILMLASAAAIRNIDRDWRDALATRLTVELAYSAANEPPAQSDIDRTLAALRAIPGIIDARTIAPDEIRSFLRPWLRDKDLMSELPLPILIDLQLDPKFRATSPSIADEILAKVPNAKLDDPGAWTRGLLGLAKQGEAFVLVFFGAIALAATISIAATIWARQALAREEIALMHTIGATDAYIAGQFQRRAFRSGLLGALLGVAFASAVMIALIQRGPAIAPFFFAQLRLSGIDWAVIGCVPAGAIILTAAVAGLTTLSSVRRLP
jgi:cell division transport system permease protein